MTVLHSLSSCAQTPSANRAQAEGQPTGIRRCPNPPGSRILIVTPFAEYFTGSCTYNVSFEAAPQAPKRAAAVCSCFFFLLSERKSGTHPPSRLRFWCFGFYMFFREALGTTREFVLSLFYSKPLGPRQSLCSMFFFLFFQGNM